MTWCGVSPHHITSIFFPVESTSLSLRGSIGVGIAVEPRARVCLGGTHSLPPTAERAVRLLGGTSERFYSILTPLPIAKGYAVSAATAIAAALAVSQVTPKTGFREALSAAHKAEILEGTGLGDVLAISCGVGVVFRLVSGEPGIGRVTCRQLPPSVRVLALEAERSMHTRVLLRTMGEPRILRIARTRLERVFDDMSFESFVRESQLFTLEAKTYLASIDGLLEQVRRTPGFIGFYSKKLVTVLFVESDLVSDAVSHLKGLRGVNIRVLEPSAGGPLLRWE